MSFTPDRTYPSDEIGFEVLSNYLMFKRGAKEIDRRELAKPIRAKIEEARKSRRKAAALSLRPTLRVVEEAKLLLVWHVEMVAREVTTFHILEVRWRSTERGILYSCTPPGSANTYLFCAHFFDRFIERGLQDDMERTIAIGKFLWYWLRRGNNRVHVAQDFSFLFFCTEGAALGHARILTDREATDDRRVHFFKTFISREMFSERQRYLEVNDTDPVSALDTDLFNL